MVLLHTMVALGIRQTTAAPQGIRVDLSVHSLGCHKMVAGTQAESSTNRVRHGCWGGAGLSPMGPC
jgi:hypothetical protein